jgi:hypothetical protein
MRKNLALLSCLFSLFSPLLAQETTVESILAPYKQFLEKGSWEASPDSLSRYESFKCAFELMEQFDSPVVVELGTTRSFQHGGLPGCNSDDTRFWLPDHPESWDWGAGFFTRMAGIALQHVGARIHTVDLSMDHLKRCKLMTSDLPNLYYHHSDSVAYLNSCSPKSIHLLYLDTGDMIPDTQVLQLEEAKVIVRKNLMVEGGIILIDDVKNQTIKQYHGDTSDLGKSKLSLPYLLNNGFEVIFDGYQVILQKKK